MSVLKNYPLMSALLSMMLAQALKIPYYYFIDRKIDWHHMFESGGMPSSHSAMAMALAVSVGLTDGWTASTFAISVAFASIVMYDAMGVRRATGKQSLLLNRLLEDMYKTGRIASEPLHEYTGHTPAEVLGGLVLGFAIALLLYFGGYGVIS